MADNMVEVDLAGKSVTSSLKKKIGRGLDRGRENVMETSEVIVNANGEMIKPVMTIKMTIIIPQMVKIHGAKRT